MIKIKSAQEVNKMRSAGKITAEALEIMKEHVKPGITTMELDRIAEKHITKSGAECSFYNYNGYPGHICVSVNNQVVHGIPSHNTVLKDGDIVSVDVGAFYDGYHGDAARTFAVGKISPEAERLISVTKESFFEGIKYAVPTNRLFDISAHVQEYVEQNGFSVVRALVGHGIGRNLHEDPEVPNFGKAGRGVRLVSGMTIAVEPMVNLGTYKVITLPDEWTVVTADGKLSAHYENTILITDNGPEILTKC
ncbi:MAG: type I methionyl aminopeptidase [Clostridia bacterium]|nr:type I methionyl aminopeptidase [Clostridia bacterium]